MLDDDGLPLDEVGPWAREKHERLRKYVDISRAVRRKFIGWSVGATYIDLYCGFGRSIIRGTNERIDGSPLVAFKCALGSGVPFSEIYMADASEERCRAAEQRLIAVGMTPRSAVGKAEDAAATIVRELNPSGLHFAFLDPYNLEDLPFTAIEALCRLRHIDILIHVSAQDLQRNLDTYSQSENSPLDRFAPGWKSQVDLQQSQRATRAALMRYWASRIDKLGLSPAEHTVLVRAPSKNQRLYWLVFVSREKLARKFWNEIRSVSGQRDLFAGDA
jgi:three-Cys-motif partner protein